jgi:hypothetical protein
MNACRKKKKVCFSETAVVNEEMSGVGRDELESVGGPTPWGECDMGWTLTQISRDVNPPRGEIMTYNGRVEAGPNSF